MAVAEILHYTYDDGEVYLTKAPKIIVEILSPAAAKKDETVKFELYQNEGVAYYILVYPEDLKAKAYRLKEGRYVKIGDLTREVLRIERIGCDAALDFGRVFAKFRNRRA